MELVVADKRYEAGRIFCIGRNYVDHARELNNEVPARPVVFIKPWTCLVPPEQKLDRPRHGSDLQHEVEIVVLIGSRGRPDSIDEAVSFIAGLTIGLDLTLRDIQNELKMKGLPWELSKAFEQSAPIGEFKAFDRSIQLDNISFSCTVNGDLRQQGNSKLMIFSIERLITELGSVWELQPGDLIYTGTPAGVGSLVSDDTISIQSDLLGTFSWEIA